MPRVYRHQYSGGRLSKKWYIEYRDHTGRLRRQPAYRDKGLSIALLAEVMAREERRAAGKEVEAPADPLFELVERYLAYAAGRGVSAKRVASCRMLLSTVFRGCRFIDVKSLNGARAQDFLDGLIAKGRTNQTYEWYRAALKAFGRWLVEKEKLIAANPFSTIDRRNPELNKKITRRVLSESDFKKLLAASKSGRVYHDVRGEDRWMLYLIAASTGLRYRACIALTPAHFDLKAGTVTSSHSMQKNRKAHVVPLPKWLVAELRKWLKGKDPRAKLWPHAEKTRGVYMVRHDLQRAGIPYKTSEGQFDFHSLRHQFATSLVRYGAGQVEVQHLLDHSSPTLSTRYFRHLKTDELRKPVERLPKL